MTCEVYAYGRRAFMSYSSIVPYDLIDAAALVVAVAVFISALYVLWKYRSRSVPPSLLEDSTALGAATRIGVFLKVFVTEGILDSSLLQKSKGRWLVHVMLFWGFLGLAITTVSVLIFYPGGEVRPFFSWIKILGNVSGAALIVGGLIALVRRGTNPQPIGRTSYDDVFLPLLIAAGITGFLSEYVRLVGLTSWMIMVYGAHLLLVLLLLASAPFTQFMHAFSAPFLALYDGYRTALTAKGYERNHNEIRTLEDAKKKFYRE